MASNLSLSTILSASGGTSHKPRATSHMKNASHFSNIFKRFTSFFKYFQTFHIIFRIFSNIFKRFTSFFEYFRMFSNVFERFCLACLAQSLQFNIPTPIFNPKTHVCPQISPPFFLFFPNSGYFKSSFLKCFYSFSNVNLCCFASIFTVSPSANLPDRIWAASRFSSRC